MKQLLATLVVFMSFASAKSLCTFSDILSNNTSCLPAPKEDIAFISLTPFDLYLQLNTVTENDINEEVRFALEYYLNYTLSQFDDNAGFDDGGFAYAIVENVELIEPSSQQQQEETVRQFSVTAGVYYNLSPAGWIFSSLPDEEKVRSQIQSLIEQSVDNDQGGTMFSQVLDKLLNESEIITGGNSPTSDVDQKDTVDENQSTMITSAAVTGSFLLLLALSGAHFIFRRDRSNKDSIKNNKDRPLHTLTEKNWDMKNNSRDVESLEENVTGENLNETKDSLTKFDDLIEQRQHSPLSSPNQINPNENSALSTSTDTSYDPSDVIGNYNEEKLAKKEMARELFLSKDQGLSSDRFRETTNADLPHSTGVDDIMSSQEEGENVDNKSNRPLEYSAPDASSSTLPQQSTKLLTTAISDIISPTLLPDRRRLLGNQQQSQDVENVTVVTDDSSAKEGNIDTDQNLPELCSTWNDLNRCLVDCTPFSWRELVSPMRQENDCYKTNENADRDQIRIDNKIHSDRCELPSSNEPDYEKDWDFADTNDDCKKIDSRIPGFVVLS